MSVIRAITLCVVRDARLLVVLKEGGQTWILPGGKPKKGETECRTLAREVEEEIGRKIIDSELLLKARSAAADQPGDIVDITAYIGGIDGDPIPAEEIEKIAWLDIANPDLPIAQSLTDHILPALRERLERPARLYHGTSSPRWAQIQTDQVLRCAPLGDTCVSLTDDIHVARYFARNACTGDEGGDPIVLAIDVTGLDAQPYSSAVWGEGSCDWERETACWEDIPFDRIRLIEPLLPVKAVRYDKNYYRLQRGEVMLAAASRLTNNRWILLDMFDRRIGKASYETPKDAAIAFNRLEELR